MQTHTNDRIIRKGGRAYDEENRGFYRKLALGFWLSAIAGGPLCGILHTGQYPIRSVCLKTRKRNFHFLCPGGLRFPAKAQRYPWEMKAIFRG